MIHVFRLGPVPASSPPTFAYAAVLPGGTLEVHQASADAPGLAALRDALKGQPLVCEPALAEGARTLRLVVAPLPQEALGARALLACELGAGLARGAVPLAAVAAYLRAAGGFWSSRLWELIAPGEPLHVTFDLGEGPRYGLLALEAADRNRPRLVFCDDPEQVLRLRGLPGEEAIAGLGQADGLTIELVDEPTWAAAALEEGAQLSRVPRLERRRGGGRAAADARDVAVGSVLLAGMVAFADLGAVGDADLVVEAGPLRVTARVGTTPPAAPSPPVDAEAASQAAEPAGEVADPVADQAAGPAEPPEAGASPPVSEPAPSGPASTAAPAEGAAMDADGPSPVGPAVIAPGADEPSPGAERPAPQATPAPTRDADELGPEALAALVKGGAAPASTPDVTVLDEVELTPEPPDQPPPLVPRPSVERAPTPIAGGAPAAASEASAPAVGPGEGRDGWLEKAWRALGGTRASGGSDTSAPKPGAPATGMAAPRPAAPAPSAKPAPPTRRAPPAQEEAPDPEGPFAPFARALKITSPAEPPPAPLAEAEQAGALAGQLTAGAVGGERFVSFPAVALQIIDLVHGQDADARGVAGFISRDPGLAADVLAVANSAAFRGVSEVGSVREAVARLGLQEVGRVASAVSARALLLPARAGGGAPSTTLFTRAVAVATAASATALRLRDAHSDRVWLAGLLHDVGIALAASVLDRLVAAGGPGVPRPVAERAVELAHVEVGAAALRGWGLPEYLADVCARHHDEAPPAGPEQVDLHLVRLTSALARLSEPEAGARAAREVVQSARALGFDAHAVRALAADLRAAEGRAAVLVR